MGEELSIPMDSDDDNIIDPKSGPTNGETKKEPALTDNQAGQPSTTEPAEKTTASKEVPGQPKTVGQVAQTSTTDSIETPTPHKEIATMSSGHPMTVEEGAKEVDDKHHRFHLPHWQQKSNSTKGGEREQESTMIRPEDVGENLQTERTDPKDASNKKGPEPEEGKQDVHRKRFSLHHIRHRERRNGQVNGPSQQESREIADTAAKEIGDRQTEAAADAGESKKAETSPEEPGTRETSEHRHNRRSSIQKLVHLGLKHGPAEDTATKDSEQQDATQPSSSQSNGIGLSDSNKAETAAETEQTPAAEADHHDGGRKGSSIHKLLHRSSKPQPNGDHTSTPTSSTCQQQEHPQVAQKPSDENTPSGAEGNDKKGEEVPQHCRHLSFKGMHRPYFRSPDRAHPSGSGATASVST